MNARQYKKMTAATGRVVNRLPGGEKLLLVPTLLCAVVYLGMLGFLFFREDERFIRAALVPALSFAAVTILRPLIHRQRPYDRFGIPPVGTWEPGKGKSMPSRHAVSAAAIALAVMYVFPTLPVCIAMTGLCLVIAALRVLSGKHYPSDVAAALVLAGLIAAIGYR